MLLLIVGFCVVTQPAFSAEVSPGSPLTLDQAIALAHRHDPWLMENQQTQAATEAQSVAAGSLPDPRMSVTLANLPTDTFDFDQEPMTQFRVGISQMFPRGQSRAIRKRQLTLTGSQFPFQRQDRRAQVTVTVTALWLSLYRTQESIALIENNRVLFEQLEDVAEAAYVSAAGRTRQSDLVRAQLELIRLEDRLSLLAQERQVLEQQLSEWLNDDNPADNRPGSQPAAASQRFPDAGALHAQTFDALRLPRELPLLTPGLATATPLSPDDAQVLVNDYLSRHPAVRAVDQKIAATGEGIQLAKQNYWPELGVNAAYGYREDAQNGDDRADFFSVGMSIDLPLFTASRQDKTLQSAVATTEAARMEKLLLLRQMLTGLGNAHTRLQRLEERQNRYRSQLLPQMAAQADASLSAYTHDDGDFAEVVRARITHLNGEIEALAIDVERQEVIARLNYFLTPAVEESATSSPTHPSGKEHPGNQP